MNKTVLLSAVTVATLSLSSLAPTQAAVVGPISAAPTTQSAGALVESVRWRGRGRGRGLALGAGIVTLGVLGAIAADRAYSRPYYDDRDGYRGQCARWRRWCNRGNDRACWRFDTRC